MDLEDWIWAIGAIVLFFSIFIYPALKETSDNKICVNDKCLRLTESEKMIEEKPKKVDLEKEVEDATIDEKPKSYYDW